MNMASNLRKEIEKNFILEYEKQRGTVPAEQYLSFSQVHWIVSFCVAEIEKRVNEPQTCDNCDSKYSAANCHGCVNSENWRAKT
jgi:ribosomal protein L40E